MLKQDDYETLAIDVADGIAVITLNRPERRNAVNDAMHSELSQVFFEAQRDPTVRVVVMTGVGRAFTLGGDTDPNRAYEPKSGRPVMEEARHIIDDIIALEKPFICAVNGHAIGLGATIASLADVSFAEHGALFGDPHVKAALPAGNGSGVIWPLLVGINRAKYLLMTGDTMPAEEAVQLGLLSKLVEKGESLNAAMDLARRWAAMEPHALAGTKGPINQLLRFVSSMVLPLSLALEDQAMQHPAYRAALEAMAAERAQGQSR